MRSIHWLLIASAGGLFVGAGCSSSDAPPSSAPVGGAVVGAENDRCAGDPGVVVDPAACKTAPSAEGEGGAPGESEGESAGGATDCHLAHDADFGETLYGSSGADDDCKYNVSWTSTPIRRGDNVTFTITAASIADGEPLKRVASQATGALPLSRVEPYLPCEPTHLGPLGNLTAPVKETAPGVFEVGPIVFDKAGRWALRFHFYETCFDSEASPHGHVAFFVDVP